ncbi:hypothetical protein PQR34_34575 [Paraburkholderia sediminicola]|uniref:hypothetical protein n=1 Tax=Paraburkholderia sediminicola TaxID=458836 RepID=UPI0038BBE06E
MRDLLEIERTALLVMGAAWGETDDLDEVDRRVCVSFERSPVAEAIAERRATGRGGITMH